MYDFAIVGGGIVGLATGMVLGQRYPNKRILVVEKESTWASHQSGRNSGVIHSGIYYRPGSLKASLTRKGSQSIVRFCQTYGISYEICGKIIVATEPSELPLLNALYDRGVANGLQISKMNSQEAGEFEPHVRCLAAIRVPTTGIVDYKQVCIKYADQIQEQGGVLKLNTKIERIVGTSTEQVLESKDDSFHTRFIINCSGLQSDRMARLGGADPKAKIVPFRGEYYELRPSKRHLVKNLIYPVPDPEFPFLGVHFTRTVDGRVHAGPNAVLSFKREGYRKTDFNLRDVAELATYPGLWKLIGKHYNKGIQELIRSFSKTAFLRNLQKLIPELEGDDIAPSASGVRAQLLKEDGSLVDDFLILKKQGAIHVCNAPSPAATSSIEIAKTIIRHLPEHNPHL